MLKQGFLSCCIHVGMHKTGTTSVQETFAHAPQGRVRAFPWPPNHSARLATLYEDDPWRIRNHRLLNRSRAEVAQLQAGFRENLRNVLAQWRRHPGISTVLFSGEQISQIGFFDPPALGRMRDELSEFCDEIRLIGYLRAPRSFVASDFQQVLKMGGPARFEFDRYWPHYRARFERMDEVFGRGAVVLRKFDPAGFVGGDVVLDLAEFVAWPTAGLHIVRSNEGIGLEAMALLYAIRRAGYGEGGGKLKATTLSMWMSDVLSPISRRKLVLAPGLLDGLMLRHSADLAWAEARLGASLEEREPTGADVIRSERDLLDIAAEMRGAIDGLDFAGPPEDAPFREDFPDISPGTLRRWVEEGLTASMV